MDAQRSSLLLDSILFRFKVHLLSFTAMEYLNWLYLKFLIVDAANVSKNRA